MSAGGAHNARRLFFNRLITLAVIGGLVLAAIGLRPAPAQATSVPSLDHVFVIVMENHSYGEIIGSSAAPYINSLAGSGGLATSYFGVTHPSLPNYLALTGASTFGITTDCTTCWVSAGNLGDALDAAGRSWKAYEESMPSACFVGSSYPYAQKHDPFIYYNDIRTNSSRCRSHVVPYSQLATDLQSTSTTPSFSFITPNMCDDMHDCSVGTGDSWLQSQVPTIVNSPAFKTQHSLLAITWDEDDSSSSNHLPLILIGSYVISGSRSATPYNHYSLLHTVEAMLGASTLTPNDANAALLSGFFGSTVTPSPSPSPSPLSNPDPSAASALPQDQLHFGVANQPTELTWMTSSGVPWRYRYQYLAGGVNTGSGWETWNSPAGAFATLYMNASSANGFIPVFSYYELLQSQPSTGTNESDRDYSNLNDATTMADYYANFKLLMQLAGAFNKSVIVHVEPDLWGYLEQRAAGGDATSISASVASSGFAEAAGLPNTVQGFAYELLKLRDAYAPKAVLAIHASPWGSGIDIASDTSTSVSAVTEADKTAAFLDSAGVASNPNGSTWDLVFNDVDDHDAGWWEQQGADNASFTHWWDPTNTKFPNFSRYLAWVTELHAKTARPQVVWQVPVGNQYFLTMNNRCGHYQDNVGPYFISHSSSLFSSGLIAVLFGAGNSCQTNNTDFTGDGVTNNGGAPTTDLLGYCNACNTHASLWPDDDGGYLRIFIGQYYMNAAWHSTGAGAPYSPAATAGSSTSEDIFVRGQDNSLYQLHWNGTTWSSWTALGETINADPGAVADGTARTDVFIRGSDNQLYHLFWNGSTWSTAAALGGILFTGPAASLRPGSPGSVDVWVAGSDGQLYHKWSDDGGNTYGAWQALGGKLTADPAAVSWSASRVDVFVRGSDDQLYHRWWSAGSPWSPWQALGGILTSAPAGASCQAGHLDVFVRGTDNGLWRLGWNGSSWSGWIALGGSWTASPSAVCRPGTDTVDVFARGSDGAVWTANFAAS